MTNHQLLKTLCAATCMAGALGACTLGGRVNSNETYAPLPGTGAVTRTAADLGYATLMGSAASLVDYSAFAVPANAANPGHTFQGTLTLNNLGTTGSFSEQGTSVARFYQDPGHLPAFSFQFVQTGTHIVPVTRGLIDTSHPNWSYILEPGRVWKETDDQGYARAAIPFSLQEKGANCTHNGVMSFLFKSDGSVSKVAYQIAGETCQYFKFNMWGLASASYTPQTIDSAAATITAYQAEVAARMPTRPIAQLAADFPASGVVPANIGSEQSPSARTLWGVAIDGINYVGGCATRYGNYPYCDVIGLPSYSLAKSVAGAIGLMRIEKKYEGVQSEMTLQATVGLCSGDQWRDVTLLNALDMATGNYASGGYEVDEGSAKAGSDFFSVDTYSQKAAHACSYPRKATPGATWVYHTSDTFLLGSALNTIYKQKEGDTKDYYRDMLVTELWKPLKMSPTTWTSTRTDDSVAHPFTGYGLTFHHDDMVKIGEFLNKDNASIGGIQMLDSTLYNEAMQRTSNHGLAAGAAGDKLVGALKHFGGWKRSLFDLGQWSAPLNGASVALAAGGSRGTTTNSKTGKKGDLATVPPYKGSATLAWDDPAQRGGVALTTVHVRAKQARPDVVTGATAALFAVPASTVMDLTAYFNLGKNATVTAGAYNLGDKKYWDYASARTLAAGTSSTALADIERQTMMKKNHRIALALASALMLGSVPVMAADASLGQRWEKLRAEQPKLQIRDAARALNVSEAELLATGIGKTVTLLKNDDHAAREIMRRALDLGKVLALTRNENGVLERTGVATRLAQDAAAAQSAAGAPNDPEREARTRNIAGGYLGGEIDLRFNFANWKHAFAVVQPGRDGQVSRSLQFFDATGTAAHK
eukprot:gene21324-24194_t